MSPFDIVPRAPATSDSRQFQFTPPPEPQPEVPTYATPPPRHYGIFQRLMGVQHAVEAQDKADEVKFLQDAIHNAILDQSGKVPPAQINQWTNRLGQLVQHPEVIKALKSHVQGVLDSRAAGKALKQVNATQAQGQTGMGVPAMPAQGASQATSAPQQPQQPPGLPAPPVAPVPFGDGGQTGGAAPPAQIPPQVKAASVGGGAGFGSQLIPLGGHFLGPTEIAVNKANADIAAQRVMANYAPEQIANGMNRLRAMGIDPTTLTAPQISEYFSKGIVPSVATRNIPRGAIEVSENGTIRSGYPEPIQTTAGTTTTIPPLTGGVQPGQAYNPNKPDNAMRTPPPGIAGSGPSAPIGSPGTSISVPPLLNESESDLLSAAQQTARNHKLPFDRTKNPRDPLAQIPTEYHGEVQAIRARQKISPEMLASTLAMRNSIEALRAIETSNATLKRADSSFQYTQNELNTIGKPISDRVGRLSELQDVLNQATPVSDSVLAPKLMTFMIGGAGSNVRITQAEINSVPGGRTAFENLKSQVARITNNPDKGFAFTDVQRKQIHQLVAAMATRTVAKQDALTSAYNELAANSTENPTVHRNLLAGTKAKLADIDEGKESMSAPPEVQFKEGNDTWSIPRGKVARFKQLHPKAQQIGKE